MKYPPRQKAASFNLDSVMASLHQTQAAVRDTKSSGRNRVRNQLYLSTNNLLKEGRRTPLEKLDRQVSPADNVCRGIFSCSIAMSRQHDITHH